jgi:hypothetical protein
MTSPLQLRRAATETGTTMVAGPLTVTPEGMFVIAGRKATLNEAIMACGAFNKKQGA